MKVIVTVKQVPDTSGKVAVNPDGTLDRASMQTIINPDDMKAVEAALALKDELGCKVVAFTMGPPPAEGMLRELMGMGCLLYTSRQAGGPEYVDVPLSQDRQVNKSSACPRQENRWKE